MLHQRPALDDAFRALADPTRRRLVDRLCQGPASASAVAAPLDMSLSAVVQHLKLLEASGLLRSEKAGRVRTFHVEADTLRSVERWIRERRATWERRLDALGEVLRADADTQDT